MLLFLWIISFLIRPFVSYDKQEMFGRIDLFIAEQLNAIPVRLSNLWSLVSAILYFVGNFSVLVLLVLGIFMLGYTGYLHAGDVSLSFRSIYSLASALAGDKVAWSGATIVVATTVAIGHMGKLSLDKRQYFEKRQQELLAENERRKKLLEERRANQYRGEA